MTYQLGTAIHPQDVVAMEAEGLLPSVVRTKWREQSHIDPISAAERCFESREKKIIWGVVWMLATIVFLGLVYWVVHGVDWAALRDPDVPETRTAVGIVVVSTCFAVFTACGGTLSFHEAGGEAHTFTYLEGGFGHDFSNLMSLLEKTPQQLVKANEADLQAMATEMLVQQAQEVLEAEQRKAEIFKDPHLPAWKYVYLRDYERDGFSQRFKVMRRFGLADPSGWGSYFAEASKRQFAKA